MTIQECLNAALLNESKIGNQKVSFLFNCALPKVKSLLSKEKIKNNKILVDDLKNRIKIFTSMYKKYSELEKKYASTDDKAERKFLKSKFEKEVKKDKEIIKMAQAFKVKDTKKMVGNILKAIGGVGLGTGVAVGAIIGNGILQDFKGSLLGKFVL